MSTTVITPSMPTTSIYSNDMNTIEIISIFRGHLPLDCSVPADRPARMMVMKVFAKKMQHSKNVHFVKMLFDKESIKLLEMPTPGGLPTLMAAEAQASGEVSGQKKLLLEIKGSAIDLVRLSKRDATFFYFTTRNASWDNLSEESSSPLLNYPLGGAKSSITGFDVFAFHATSPRAAERCFRLLQQFAEINVASEQLMVKLAPTGAHPSGGFFHGLAESFLSSTSTMPTVADAASNTTTTTTTTITTTNHNNNIISVEHCDGKPSKQNAMSMKSIFGFSGEAREAHHVTFASGLETVRGTNNDSFILGGGENGGSLLSQSQPPSADLLLLCDFNSTDQQHSDTSMTDLFDDLSSRAPPAKVLAAAGGGGGPGGEVDLLGDLFKSAAATSTLPNTSFTPAAMQQAQQQQQIPFLPPPPQQRPMHPLPQQPQPQQQPMLVPTNPFTGAPVYGNFVASNPFAAMQPLQPQPVAPAAGQFQSFGGGRTSSLNTSAFSTDFNDFLQQTVKGHFKA